MNYRFFDMYSIDGKT